LQKWSLDIIVRDALYFPYPQKTIRLVSRAASFSAQQYLFLFCFQEKFSVEIDSSSNVSLSDRVECVLVASSEEDSFSGFSPEDQIHQESTSDAAQNVAKEIAQACFSINPRNLS